MSHRDEWAKILKENLDHNQKNPKKVDEDLLKKEKAYDKFVSKYKTWREKEKEKGKEKGKKGKNAADGTLRDGLTRLANERPELRKHLVPLLKGDDSGE